jgi:hypothetical protein
MDKQEWDRLWKAVHEVEADFEPGTIFIGGIAVYAHTIESLKWSAFHAFTHDADLMISTSDYVDMSDIEQLTPNRRLNKSQFVKDGFEFNVYVEGRHGLTIPYEEAHLHSEIKAGIRVACLEHLLILKLRAFESRRNSTKGMKDEEDIFKLLMLVSETGTNPDRLVRLDDESMDLLRQIPRSGAALRVTMGNAHLASEMRHTASNALGMVESAVIESRNTWKQP